MADIRSLVVIGTAHPLRGGLAAYNERLAREYGAQGVQTSIYTFSLQYPSFLFPGKTQYSAEPAPADLDIRVRINSINPFNWFSVGRELKRTAPDLVIIKFWMPFMAPCLGTIARNLRKNRHSRVISILDNVIPHEPGPGDRMLVRYWINSVDGFIAMSDSVMHDLELFDRKKPRLFCPHPLYDHYGELLPKEQARRMLGLSPEGRYILFFGFIRDYKGLDILLAAMASERLRNMDVRLLVAGEFYTDPEPYRHMIRELGLEDRVIMANDFIPDSRVAEYFSACDLVVQPYKSATQSGVTQIAYHFDKPMVVTRVGGLPELVPDGRVGWVVAPEPGEVAEAIVRFYLEGHEQEFISNMADEKKKYSWERLTGAIDELLASI
ncbi:MAG: glycosyltransferase [Bacteroidales bacterium]|nr:glycosyltransferase [Bacteroidales bacterium]